MHGRLGVAFPFDQIHVDRRLFDRAGLTDTSVVEPGEVGGLGVSRDEEDLVTVESSSGAGYEIVEVLLVNHASAPKTSMLLNRQTGDAWPVPMT